MQQYHRAKGKEYSKAKLRCYLAELVLTAVFFLVFYFSGASAALVRYAGQRAEGFYGQLAVYLVVFFFLYIVLFIWFDYYRGFLLEHRYGLSEESFFTWGNRKMKKVLLSLPLFVVVLEGLYLLFRNFPEYWYVPATIAWFGLTVVISRILPTVIIPLFYKCGPLEKGEMREKLLQLGGRCGVDVSEVYRIELSAETKKANAAVVGLGGSKRVLLGDTLINDYSPEEIEAVFAHELGHLKMHHTWKIAGFVALVSFVAFYLTSVALKAQLRLFEFERIFEIEAVPLVMLTLTVVLLALTPMQNVFMRFLERKADLFAIKTVDNSEYLVSALDKLAEQNLSDRSPDRFTEIWLYDHPPVDKRIEFIRNSQAKAG